MPRPVTAWAVELMKGSPMDEVRGMLALEEEGLVFTPDDERRPPTRIALGSISKVRRLRGSPVLMVVRTADTGTRRTAFYFAQPPPLGTLLGQTTERPAGLAGFRNPRRKARRDNVGYLGVVNREKKVLLNEWARALRSAAGGAA